ncbi:unnamed protein product [Somion occarium]|uniref:SnoaL-like domain-containing protein n=1 Tax=Somion occarium TaxID=3059160 RepID=A0ABP1E4W3_9APHY
MVVEVSAAISANPSPQIQLVLKWVEAAIGKDFATLEAIITDDYVQTVHPDNLGAPLHKGKEPFLTHYKTVLPLFVDFSVKILEIIETPDTVVVHAKGSAKTQINYDYENEYIMIFHIVKQQDGQLKLSSAKEFVDSKFMAGFRQAVEAALTAKK